MRCLLHAAAGLRAADYLAAADGLLQAVEAEGAAPRLGIFGLEGDALLLGRHQRASSAIAPEAAQTSELEILRRPSGGRCVYAGTGTIAVALALPTPSALLAAPIPLAKVLNRYVRGVLAAMSGLGVPTHYFGRDELVLAGGQVGYAAFEARSGGATLVEFFLGIGRPTCPPEGLSAYPPRLDFPAPRACVTAEAILGERVAFERVKAALVEGFERALGVRFEGGDPLPRGAMLPVAEEERGLGCSGVGEIPIGYLEALVRRDGSLLGEVRLRGDFICPAEAVRRLERELTGLEPRFEVLAPRVDRVFQDPFAVPMGIRVLRIVPDAVVAACADA